jgi:chromosome segregation ATPase
MDQVWVRALVPVSTKENGKDRKIPPGECFLMDRAEAVKEAQTRNPAVVLTGMGADEKPVSNEEVIKQLEDGIRLRDSQIQQLTDLVTEGKEANLAAEKKIQQLTDLVTEGKEANLEAEKKIQQLTDLVTEGKEANLEAEKKIQELIAEIERQAEVIKDQATQLDLLKQAVKSKKTDPDKKDQ